MSIAKQQEKILKQESSIANVMQDSGLYLGVPHASVFEDRRIGQNTHSIGMMSTTTGLSSLTGSGNSLNSIGLIMGNIGNVNIHSNLKSSMEGNNVSIVGGNLISALGMQETSNKDGKKLDKKKVKGQNSPREETEAKEKRRVRNKELARSSRMKKKVELEALQIKLKDLANENEILRRKIENNFINPVPAKILLATDIELPEKIITIVERMTLDANQYLQDTETETTITRALIKEKSFCISNALSPDCPMVYASPGFLKLTGYSLDEIIGRNCRVLQGPGTDMKEVVRIRTALETGIDVTAILLNYRKNGSHFWNRVSLCHLVEKNLIIDESKHVHDKISNEQENEMKVTTTGKQRECRMIIGMQVEVRNPKHASSSAKAIIALQLKTDSKETESISSSEISIQLQPQTVTIVPISFGNVEVKVNETAAVDSHAMVQMPHVVNIHSSGRMIAPLINEATVAVVTVPKNESDAFNTYRQREKMMQLNVKATAANPHDMFDYESMHRLSALFTDANAVSHNNTMVPHTGSVSGGDGGGPTSMIEPEYYHYSQQGNQYTYITKQMQSNQRITDSNHHLASVASSENTSLPSSISTLTDMDSRKRDRAGSFHKNEETSAQHHNDVLNPDTCPVKFNSNVHEEINRPDENNQRFVDAASPTKKNFESKKDKKEKESKEAARRQVTIHEEVPDKKHSVSHDPSTSKTVDKSKGSVNQKNRRTNPLDLPNSSSVSPLQQGDRTHNSSNSRGNRNSISSSKKTGSHSITDDMTASSLTQTQNNDSSSLTGSSSASRSVLNSSKSHSNSHTVNSDSMPSSSGNEDDESEHSNNHHRPNSTGNGNGSRGNAATTDGFDRAAPSNSVSNFISSNNATNNGEAEITNWMPISSYFQDIDNNGQYPSYFNEPTNRVNDQLENPMESNNNNYSRYDNEEEDNRERNILQCGYDDTDYDRHFQHNDQGRYDHAIEDYGDGMLQFNQENESYMLDSNPSRDDFQPSTLEWYPQSQSLQQNQSNVQKESFPSSQPKKRMLQRKKK